MREVLLPVGCDACDGSASVSYGEEGIRIFDATGDFLILKEAEAGAKVTELCRRHGISDATFYTWRSKYGGLEVSETRRLCALAEERSALELSAGSAVQ